MTTELSLLSIDKWNDLQRSLATLFWRGGT